MPAAEHAASEAENRNTGGQRERERPGIDAGQHGASKLTSRSLASCSLALCQCEDLCPGTPGGSRVRRSPFSTESPFRIRRAVATLPRRGCGVRQETYSPGPYRSSRELSLTRSLDRDTRRPPTL